MCYLKLELNPSIQFLLFLNKNWNHFFLDFSLVFFCKTKFQFDLFCLLNAFIKLSFSLVWIQFLIQFLKPVRIFLITLNYIFICKFELLYFFFNRKRIYLCWCQFCLLLFFKVRLYHIVIISFGHQLFSCHLIFVLW